MDTKDPRKLDFDAPLLSTRRTNCVISLELPRSTHRETHIRVPFSWEQCPGKPKEGLETRGDFTDSWVPQPRPPPGWHPPLQKEHDFNTDSWVRPPPRPPPGWHPTLQKEHDFVIDSWVPSPSRPPPGWHPPLKVETPLDQESEYDADYDDNFFDAIDVFSFYEAFDIMVEQRNALGGLNLEPRGNKSPNFIIHRFLSDAKALAVSSGLDISNNFNNDSGVDFSRKWVPATESESPPKGCGLDVFYPWRMKNKPCGAKSLARVRSKDVKARCSSRQKKSSSCMNEI